MNKNFISVIAFLLTLTLGLVLIWPKYQSLGNLRATIKEKNAELQSKKEYFSQIQEVSEELKKYEENFSKIASALPSDPALPSLLNFLQKTASQTGLLLEDIELSGLSVQSNRKKEINLGLLLSGSSYLPLKDFLLAIEKSTRLIEVSNISFSTPTELKAPFSFKVTIKTHSY